MRIKNLKYIKKISKDLFKKDAPILGIVIAGAGFTSAIGTSIKATVQAVRNSDAETTRLGRELTFREQIELNWKLYIQTMLLWLGSVTALCFAGKSHSKSIKALATLYAASETARQDLEEVALKKFGTKKYEEFQEEVAQKELDRNPVSKSIVIDTGYGDYLCYDSLSGRYFRSCMDHIKRSVNAFNNRILTQKDGYSYNDLFYEISPKFDDIEFGEDIGWGPSNGIADLYYISKLAENGEPCLVMKYNIRPYRDYCM